MKPENNLPNISAEQMPSMPRPNIERELNPGGVEFGGIENSKERIEQISELSAIIADVNQSTSAQTTNKTLDATAPIVNDTTIGNPSSAKDDDLIEKEWVDRAKKILEDTTGDPYVREEKVSELQADYLKKRYNKDVSIAE